MTAMPLGPDARAVITAAAACAHKRRFEYIGAEHLLLGVIRHAPAHFAGPLSPGDLETRVIALAGRGTRRTASKDEHLPYTSAAKRVRRVAQADAQRGGHAAVGIEHLLTGLVADKGHAGRTLRKAGYGRSASTTADRPPQAEVTIVLDDASDRPYYEQIMAHIQEAVAAGTLHPGDRLPAVRRLADTLQLAPGTVARAYGELEADGIVATNGPKGTVIAFPDDDRAPKRGRTVAGTGGVVAARHRGSVPYGWDRRGTGASAAACRDRSV